MQYNPPCLPRGQLLAEPRELVVVSEDELRQREAAQAGVGDTGVLASWPFACIERTSLPLPGVLHEFKIQE